MRIYHSVFALLCMVVPFLFSCSSDAPDLELQLKQESINEGESHVSAPQMVEFEGEQTLKFKNVMSLQHYLQHVPETDNFVQKHSFFSAYRAVDRSISDGIMRDSVLFLGGDDFQTIKIKSQLYALYRVSTVDGAYDPYPICRARSLSESMIANKSGHYLIGDSICTLGLYDNYDEAIGASGTYNEVSSHSIYSHGFRANNAFGKTSNRKCRGVIGMDANSKRLYIKVTAQKQVGFIVRWWIRYATTYMGRLIISQIGQPIVIEPSGGFEYIRQLLRGGTVTENCVGKKFLPSSGRRIIEFAIERETGDDTFTLGKFMPVDDPMDPLYGQPCSIKGQIEFWSRGVPYGDRGSDEIDLNLAIS